VISGREQLQVEFSSYERIKYRVYLGYCSNLN
jgi:hypothetical protein